MELDPAGTRCRRGIDRTATPPNSFPTLYLSISKRLDHNLWRDYKTNLLLNAWLLIRVSAQDEDALTQGVGSCLYRLERCTRALGSNRL
jgi:hypothetical protein